MIHESARPHDLLRLRAPGALTADTPVPPWVEAALRALPWVVVRRGPVRGGRVPVGVRGAARAQRFAAFVALGEVSERRAPEELTRVPAELDLRRREAVPALSALARVSTILGPRGQGWGPGGSVGFELATGAPTATPSSDLDLVLRQQRRLAPSHAARLLAALVDAAAPARLDVMLETPLGGVSLAELAAAPARVLVRTAIGPRLRADPWEEG